MLKTAIVISSVVSTSLGIAGGYFLFRKSDDRKLDYWDIRRDLDKLRKSAIEFKDYWLNSVKGKKEDVPQAV